MVKKIVSLIDYGVGNLLSVSRALEECGANVRIIKTPEEILKSDRIILPGVGAFGNCIQELRQRDLEESILEFVAKEKPLLGICVGMQILLEIGEEFGSHKGLGLFSGRVNKIPEASSRKVPFIGWAQLRKSRDEAHTIFKNIDNESFFYFVHSFQAQPSIQNDTLALYEYDDLEITALINKENVFGCQFHPEKSGQNGLKFLSNFLNF